MSSACDLSSHRKLVDPSFTQHQRITWASPEIFTLQSTLSFFGTVLIIDRSAAERRLEVRDLVHIAAAPPLERNNPRSQKTMSRSTLIGLNTSTSERRYVTLGVELGMRGDGRGRLDYRTLSVQAGVLAQVRICRAQPRLEIHLSIGLNHEAGRGHSLRRWAWMRHVCSSHSQRSSRQHSLFTIFPRISELLHLLPMVWSHVSNVT